MILGKVAVAAWIVYAATGPTLDPSVAALSFNQKQAATRVYTRSATDCIAQSITSDSRFRRDDPTSHLSDLIVDSMPKCLGPVRAMIDAFDRSFGNGAGEEFLMGAYLDILPDRVLRLIRNMPD